MKEDGSLGALKEVRDRAKTIAALQLGTALIPCGVLFAFLSILEGSTVWGNRWLQPWPANITFHILQFVLLVVGFCTTVLVAVLIYQFHTRKVGMWFPSLKLSKADYLVMGLGVGLLVLAMMVQYLPDMVFPWFGLAFGLILSLCAILDRHYQRWYYPAVCIPLVGVCFLPMIMGLTHEDAGWTRVVCFGAYGLTQILLGTLDHAHLMRILKPVEGVPDGQTI